jgi:hypothetical protein
VVVPTTPAAEFHSQEFGGITYRVAVQRAMTAAGEMVVALADGSDVRQQWRHQLLTHVLLPNMLLVVVAALLIYWSVRKAFKPLLDLAQAVESRSPRDLSPIDETTRPRKSGRWCSRSTGCSAWCRHSPKPSAALWPMPPTSCARPWRRCRPRWKPGH